MRIACTIAAVLVLAPVAAAAQSSPARSVLLPPNPIDRATAASDARNADARRAADADRQNASIAARNAADRTGQVPQSTMTDGVAGFGTRAADGPATTITPPR